MIKKFTVTVSNFQNYLVMQLQFFLPELILQKYSVEGYTTSLCSPAFYFTFSEFYMTSINIQLI